MWEKVWRWADVRADVREDVKMSRCERRCEDEQMWEKMLEKMWEKIWRKMSRWEKMWEKMWEKIWRKMSRWEKMWEKMWEKIWRWADVREDVKMSRCEDEQMWRWVDVKMRRCEDEKVRYRPPLLEEPCAQTLSGMKRTIKQKHAETMENTWEHTEQGRRGDSGTRVIFFEGGTEYAPLYNHIIYNQHYVCSLIPSLTPHRENPLHSSAALPGFTSHHDLQEATIGQLHLPFHYIPLQCFSRVIHLIDSNRFE